MPGIRVPPAIVIELHLLLFGYKLPQHYDTDR